MAPKNIQTSSRMHLSSLKTVLDLIDKHSLDTLEWTEAGIKVTKSRHVSHQAPAAPGARAKDNQGAPMGAPTSIEELDKQNEAILGGSALTGQAFGVN